MLHTPEFYADFDGTAAASAHAGDTTRSERAGGGHGKGRRVFVGIGRLVLHLPGARTLKEKRMTVRSFRDRVIARHHVSVAEVADQDVHQRAVFGVAVVSNDASVCDEVLAAVAREANTLRDAVLADQRTEIISLGEGGMGLRGDLVDRALSRSGAERAEEDDDG